MSTTFSTMGTVASLEVRGEFAAVEALRAVFDELEARFSLYDGESELSRIAAGALALPDASPDLLAVYESALEWRRLTDGAFTPHRPDGVVDLDGVVKALAIDRAAGLLPTDAAWCLNVGGDILTNGSPWRLGIVDPLDRGAILCAVDLVGTRRALATSGTSERGEHVWRTRDAASAPFTQVSVLAGDVVTADVLATAILAGDEAARDQLCSRFDIDVLTVDRAGSLAATPGLRAALAA
ncbi:MAG: thiamine biosynthesis protein [Microbacteriaceae bacterium]|nr:thiamine biosynthesis protein [Microbacteriaceae bacterium]